jgi:hypothetical protein
METTPDTLAAVGVNELLVAVTVDASFTTEQAVVGRIDEMQILSAVRTAPMVGYLSGTGNLLVRMRCVYCVYCEVCLLCLFASVFLWFIMNR